MAVSSSVKELSMRGSDPVLNGIKRGGDMNEVAELILTDNVNLEAQGPEWDGTPLYWAAALGLLELVQILLQFGANVHAVTRTRATPLHAAADTGRAAIVRELLSHGACVDDVTIFGDTCGHLATYRGHTDVMHVLLQHGLDTDTKNARGLTMLQVAETRQRHDIIKLLESYSYYAC